MKHRTITLLASLLASGAALAQAPEPAPNVQTRHDQLAKLKEALADPDPLSRLASMEAAVASGDATETNLAMRIAFASDDPQMRGLAMRVWVGTLKHLTMDVLLPDDVRKEVDRELYQTNKKDDKAEQPRWLTAWSGRSFEVSLIFSNADVAKGSGSVVTTPTCCGIKPVDFAVTGTQLFVSVPVLFPGFTADCHMRVEPAANLSLTGSIACNFGFPSPKLPISGPMF